VSFSSFAHGPCLHPAAILSGSQWPWLASVIRTIDSTSSMGILCAGLCVCAGLRGAHAGGLAAADGRGAGAGDCLHPS
jgi:hypothetical protein